MAFVAEGHRAEGQFRRLESTLNKLKYPKFRFGMRRPTASKGQGDILNNNNNNNNNNYYYYYYYYTNNNWSHWNSNEKLKEKFGSCTRKTFNRFTTKDSCTWNITHNMESTAV